jgi:hypothetical protein
MIIACDEYHYENCVSLFNNKGVGASPLKRLRDTPLGR